MGRDHSVGADTPPQDTDIGSSQRRRSPANGSMRGSQRSIGHRVSGRRLRGSPQKCVARRPHHGSATSRPQTGFGRGSRTVVSHLAVFGAAMAWAQTAHASPPRVLQYPDGNVLMFRTIADLWPIAVALCMALIAHNEVQRARRLIAAPATSRASWGKELLVGLLTCSTTTALGSGGRPAKTTGLLSLTAASPSTTPLGNAVTTGMDAASQPKPLAKAIESRRPSPPPPPSHPPPPEGPLGQASDGYDQLMASTASLPPELLRTAYLVDTGTQISLVCSKENLTDMVPLAKPLAWASAAEGQAQQASHRGTLTIALVATDGSVHTAKIPEVYYAASARLNAMSPTDLNDAGVMLKLNQPFDDPALRRPRVSRITSDGPRGPTGPHRRTRQGLPGDPSRA